MAVVDDSVDRWLLEAKTPSIRYFTLRDLLHKPETDVQAARQAMAADGPISQILALQTETGQWANEYSYYTPKYRSTHWSMMLLTELGIDPEDERFQRGIDFMLSASQPQQEEHVNGSAYGLLCLWGNLLRYTAYGKQLDDPRALRLMVCIQQQAEQAAWRCPHNGGLPCVVRTLWALPPERRDQAVNATIQNGLEMLLESFSLVQANYPSSGDIHKLWHSLNFPMFYQVDILFTLRVVMELGQLAHPGAQAALNWPREQRQNVAAG